MPPLASFDVTTGVDLQEVDNAINQAQKEIAQRYDFKGSKASIDFKRAEGMIALVADSDFQMTALFDVVQTKLIKRGVSVKNLDVGELKQAGGDTVRRDVKLKMELDPDTAKKVAATIKDAKLKKVQAAIQGEQVRVSGPSRDDLQQAIALLRGKDFGVEGRRDDQGREAQEGAGRDPGGAGAREWPVARRSPASDRPAARQGLRRRAQVRELPLVVDAQPGASLLARLRLRGADRVSQVTELGGTRADRAQRTALAGIPRSPRALPLEPLDPAGSRSPLVQQSRRRGTLRVRIVWSTQIARGGRCERRANGQRHGVTAQAREVRDVQRCRGITRRRAGEVDPRHHDIRHDEVQADE